MTVANHYAEVAVPGQLQITVRAAHGELELGQEYDGEWHGIYIRPENVLMLIRAMLRMIGEDNLYLYRQKPGGLCHDLEWPEGLPIDDQVEVVERVSDRKSNVGTAAERQRKRRAKKRDGKRGTERDIGRDSVTVTNGHALPLLERQELVS
jgi:hypothetical protein